VRQIRPGLNCSFPGDVENSAIGLGLEFGGNKRLLNPETVRLGGQNSESVSDWGIRKIPVECNHNAPVLASRRVNDLAVNHVEDSFGLPFVVIETAVRKSFGL
jgi:hypothetical protein